MLVLAIDTTTSMCSAALAEEGRLLAELSTNIANTHSQRLLPIIDTLFRETDLKPDDLDLLAVSRGPGSFTGLRIGIATVKGLGLALDIPVAGFSSLHVLAHNFGGSGLVCPVLNARRDQVYTGLFRIGKGSPEEIISGRAVAVPALLEDLSRYKETIWFCGDGVDLVIASAGEFLEDPRPVPLHLQGNRAAALADLALKAQSIPIDQLTPLYLRESQAEILLRRKLADQNGQ